MNDLISPWVNESMMTCFKAKEFNVKKTCQVLCSLCSKPCSPTATTIHNITTTNTHPARGRYGTTQT